MVRVILTESGSILIYVKDSKLLIYKMMELSDIVRYVNKLNPDIVQVIAEDTRCYTATTTYDCETLDSRLSEYVTETLKRDYIFDMPDVYYGVYSTISKSTLNKMNFLLKSLTSRVMFSTINALYINLAIELNKGKKHTIGLIRKQGEDYIIYLCRQGVVYSIERFTTLEASERVIRNNKGKIYRILPGVKDTNLSVFGLESNLLRLHTTPIYKGTDTKVMGVDFDFYQETINNIDIDKSPIKTLKVNLIKNALSQLGMLISIIGLICWLIIVETGNIKSDCNIIPKVDFISSGRDGGIKYVDVKDTQNIAEMKSKMMSSGYKAVVKKTSNGNVRIYYE